MQFGSQRAVDSEFRPVRLDESFAQKYPTDKPMDFVKIRLYTIWGWLKYVEIPAIKTMMT
jgi:hypothetical protein